MIWNSVPLMTLFDLLILSSMVYTTWIFHRHYQATKKLGLVIGVRAILFGLILIALFYLSDLFSMHILPSITNPAFAIRSMMDLHLNWIWVGVLISVGSIAFGISHLVQILIPKTLANFEDLELAKNNLSEQIVEIEQINLNLEKTTGKLEDANQELESFAYSVAHDLRAPLRAVNGFSRILLEDYMPQFSPEAARYLGMMEENAQQMGRLIDDLLVFSRLSRQELKKQSVAPAELARQALKDLGNEQQGRSVEISIGDLPTIQADPALLKQVFINLLANALKFTLGQEVAHIEVGYQQSSEDQPVYFVKDNGVGFDMQYADKLFGVFQRLHSEEKFEGTGAGLAIVQRIIHRHGGRIWAEAEVDQGGCIWAEAEVDKGAIFYFKI